MQAGAVNQRQEGAYFRTKCGCRNNAAYTVGAPNAADAATAA